MRRTLSLVSLLGSLFFTIALTAQQLEIHYIDVGWGGSVLVRGPNGTTVLMDAGIRRRERTTSSPTSRASASSPNRGSAPRLP
jgi:beta-lactamase superfamily II metal-dependent hydrolase